MAKGASHVRGVHVIYPKSHRKVVLDNISHRGSCKSPPSVHDFVFWKQEVLSISDGCPAYWPTSGVVNCLAITCGSIFPFGVFLEENISLRDPLVSETSSVGHPLPVGDGSTDSSLQGQYTF
jgi:hypothetical protein